VARDVRAAAARDDRVSTALGFVPTSAVQTYLRAADVVALPFRTEHQTLLTSGSVLLAMGFGRAVVAPRLGCVGDTLAADTPDGGTVGPEPTVERTVAASGSGPVRVVAGGVVYESTAQLETALRTALDADLDRMGRRNRAHVETLGWDDIAARTAEVYAGSDGSP
jgi:glycosyltransferase involved in cell wall biosynthesis